MLELRDAQLELIVLPARDYAQLLEEPIKRSATPLPDSAGFALPAQHQLFNRLTSLVLAHATPCGELVGQSVGPLGSQRNGTERGQAELLDGVAETGTAIGGHVGASVAFGGVAGA